MKFPLLIARATFKRLVDPNDFQPFTVFTKKGLHAHVPTPDRAQSPPDDAAGYVRVYLDLWGEMINFS